MYDLIGDIHGHALPLKQLLAKLDYTEKNGFWQHPERKVVFLGDFIDRGPEQVEAVLIAKAMVENNAALAVMGNHEFNAVAWTMPNHDKPGEFLRPHTERYLRQHQIFLEQVIEGSTLHQEITDWFATLPLFLEFPGFRVIHACWHLPSLKILAPFLDTQNRIQPQAWPILSAKGTETFEALETVLKGLNIELPSGYGFDDKDGNFRNEIRAQWWELNGLTYRDLAMVPPSAIEQIPHIPVPNDIVPGYQSDKPLFVGHYWMTGEPEPLTPYIACLDYSIAARNTKSLTKGKLCAYRWQGETELLRDRFIWVS